jgi:undecaprenyl pyrophosphate synthase
MSPELSGQVGAVFDLATARLSRSSAESFDVVIRQVSTAGDERLSHVVPQMIPRGELIFWTPEWRALEAESLRELSERAEPREFSNFRELARWLLSADEE